MKAACVTAYGPPSVVTLAEVPRPDPAPGQVLVRVQATTVSSGDARIRAMEMPAGFGLMARLGLGLRRPRQPVLGVEATGIVTAIGPGVTRFAPGDAVILMTGMKMGCHAEYVVVADGGAIIARPAGMDVETAAALAFGGTTALHFLRACGVGPGLRVLVIGAAGTVGSAVVQIARHRGAQITGVCSAGSADTVRALGAEAVIDRQAVNLTTLTDRWDVIVDAIGSTPVGRLLGLLVPGGRLARIVMGLPDIPAALANPLRSAKVIIGTAPERAADLAELATLAQAGAFRPLIDSTYPLARIAEAHARADGHRKRGSVVVTVGEGG